MIWSNLKIAIIIEYQIIANIQKTKGKQNVIKTIIIPHALLVPILLEYLASATAELTAMSSSISSSTPPASSSTITTPSTKVTNSSESKVILWLIKFMSHRLSSKK